MVDIVGILASRMDTFVVGSNRFGTGFGFGAQAAVTTAFASLT